MTITLSTRLPGEAPEFVTSMSCEEDTSAIAEAILSMSRAQWATMASWFELCFSTDGVESRFVFDKAYRGMDMDVANALRFDLARKKQKAA